MKRLTTIILVLSLAGVGSFSIYMAILSSNQFPDDAKFQLEGYLEGMSLKKPFNYKIVSFKRVLDSEFTGNTWCVTIDPPLMQEAPTDQKVVLYNHFLVNLSGGYPSRPNVSGYDPETCIRNSSVCLKDISQCLTQ